MLFNLQLFHFISAYKDLIKQVYLVFLIRMYYSILAHNLENLEFLQK